MTTRNVSKLARTLLACSVLTTSLAACATTQGADPVKPSLPHESTVVPDQVAAPNIQPGMDARVAWRMEEAARTEANNRLGIARKNVRNMRIEYAK